MITRRFTIALVFMLLFIAGCGQKGELYLPEPPASPEQQQDEDEGGDG